jgi:hypothetical protein
MPGTHFTTVVLLLQKYEYWHLQSGAEGHDEAAVAPAAAAQLQQLQLLLQLVQLLLQQVQLLLQQLQQV